ncbi:MAG: alpha/beta fold hydrolase [Deltaproteobacteria bacterium]|nr:alpha/beta fold hydrolase [Deltaproteobacteria bacterium]
MKISFRRIMQSIRFLTTGCAITLVIIGAIIVYYQDALILPASLHQRASAAAPQEIEERFIVTRDAVRIRLWHKRDRQESPSSLGAGRAIILLNGNGDTVRSSLNLQEYFSALGFSTYSIDYRGTGRSDGQPSEQGLYADVDAAWEYVSQSFPSDKITLLGRSFGTGLASYLAAKHGGKSLILISPYLSIPKIVRDRGALGLLTPFLRYDIPTEKFIPSLKNSCVVAAHGVVDEVIKVHHTEELAVTNGSGTSLQKIIIPAADHDSILGLAQEQMLEGLKDCLKRAASTHDVADKT